MIPLIAFDDFRDPPTISSFYKQIWVIGDPPFWVLSNVWFPLLFH